MGYEFNPGSTGPVALGADYRPPGYLILYFMRNAGLILDSMCPAWMLARDKQEHITKGGWYIGNRLLTVFSSGRIDEIDSTSSASQ